MKVKLLLIAILVPMLVVSVTAKAKIQFESTEVSFGEIDSGKVVDLEFKFKNVGDETLIIKNISASCGCTATKLKKRDYKPGETGILPVKFNSRGYNGKISKTITISTNDEDQVYTRLKVVGSVILKDFAALELKGDRLTFKDAEPGKTYKDTVVVKNTGTIDLRFIEVTHSPDVVIEFEESQLKPGKEGKIYVTVTPRITGTVKKPRYATFIKLRSNAYRQPFTIIKVSVEMTK